MDSGNGAVKSSFNQQKSLESCNIMESFLCQRHYYREAIAFYGMKGVTCNQQSFISLKMHLMV